MPEQRKPQAPKLPEPRHPIPAAPVHPLAALATIVLDNIFALPELAGPEMWIFTIPIIGGISLLTTTLVQHFLAKDGWGEALAKGLVMGIIAGVPISVTGTAAGGILLAWAGLHEWVRQPAAELKPEQPSGTDEIVEADFKDVE